MGEAATRPILYSFRRCPYAIRARLAIWQADIAVAHREILLRDKPPEMLAISPKGTVPVLQLPDGTVIDESIDVMRWALSMNDPDDWLTVADEAQIDALVCRNDLEFKPLLDAYKYPERHGERSQAQWRDAALDTHLLDLDARLAQHRHLLGARRSLADAALFPFVRQFAGVNPVWFEQASLPHLRAWLNDWLNSDLFSRVMAKQPLFVSAADA